MIHLGDAAEYLRQVQRRATLLGLTEADYAVARKPGDRRTPEKRELLRRIADRCSAGGVKPLPAKL